MMISDFQPVKPPEFLPMSWKPDVFYPGSKRGGFWYDWSIGDLQPNFKRRIAAYLDWRFPGSKLCWKNYASDSKTCLPGDTTKCTKVVKHDMKLATTPVRVSTCCQTVWSVCLEIQSICIYIYIYVEKKTWCCTKIRQRSWFHQLKKTIMSIWKCMYIDITNVFCGLHPPTATVFSFKQKLHEIHLFP